jgi:biotin operon repressor
MPEPEQTDGFTPLPDAIVKRYGVIVAAVYGRMWRYSQMQDGVCRASFQTLASDLNLGRATVIRAVARLEADGLILDTTPDKIKSIHAYKLIPTSSITVIPEVKRHLVSQRSQTSITADKSSITVIHKDSIKRREKEAIPNGIANAPPTKPEPDPRVKALVLGFQDLVGYGLQTWAQESAAAKKLLKSGYEPADIYNCWRYMTSDSFWEGKHCGLSSVAKQIGAWVKAGRPKTRNGKVNDATTRRHDTRRSSWAQPDGHTAEDIDRILAERAAEDAASG